MSVKARKERKAGSAILRQGNRSVRRPVLGVLGLGMVFFIALFTGLFRGVIPLLVRGAGGAVPETAVTALNGIIMILAILVIIFLYALYGIISRLVLDPLGELTREVHQMTSAGRLGPGRYTSYGELKALSGSINDMVEKLSQSTMSTGVFRSIFNGLEAFLFVSDPETCEVFFINDSMKAAFGLDGRAVGRPCWELFEEGQHGPCPFCPVPKLKDLPEKRYAWEAFNSKTGKYYRHTQGLIEWNGQGGRAMLQHTIDMTELKETENALIAARNQAEASNAEKTDFLARMSHEMRTPLNAIIGMTTVARQNTGDTEKIGYALPKIHEASVHLLSLITDILDMSNIEAGRLKLDSRKFSFEKMIRHVADIITFRLDEKKHRFSISIAENVPKTIIADEQRLSQVLTNLLSNAIKFTPPEGFISLSAREAARGEGGLRTLHFEVSDTGTGIPPEQIGRIFALFEQGEGSLDRKYGGAGLGLAICKSLVKMMGGEISVESEPGRGSNFMFDVTVQAETAADGNPAAAGNPAADACPAVSGSADFPDGGGFPDFSGKTILLVDDIEINREIAMALLEDTGVAIDCAESGGDAFRLFAENPGKYQAILMDVHMPGMDGLEATRRIRAFEAEHGTAGGVPVIAMTANVFREDVDKCLAAGMNAHLGKPVELEAVLDTLRAWL